MQRMYHLFLHYFGDDSRELEEKLVILVEKTEDYYPIRKIHQIEIWHLSLGAQGGCLPGLHCTSISGKAKFSFYQLSRQPPCASRY